MIRRLSWLLVLLALPSIACAVDFCRSYTITADTYFDYANPDMDLSGEDTMSMESWDAASELYYPFIYLQANALGAGETFDFATLVVWPNMSPTHAGTYNVYRVLGSVPDGVAGATWLFRDSGHLWATGGCQYPGQDYYATPVYTGASWSGSQDTVQVAYGVTFSNFVRDYVLGSNQYIIMRFDGTTPTAYCQWSASGTAHPMKLRIYGHRNPAASSRRKAMYGQP